MKHTNEFLVTVKLSTTAGTNRRRLERTIREALRREYGEDAAKLVRALLTEEAELAHA